ncbi:serine/arginine repetitive matrix protein 1 isoform X7 [Cydia fagiglandana]|uniref:serine/arginine repetitive matrix protein 1 isoform X7 n=1 Tax=Cydia fagiglandana TaxID=1458189 RepID=UPI002FEDF3AF
MIGSFWNLCRACPSMPVDKLHSEYRSTYRWHQYREQQGVVKQPAASPPSALPIPRGPMEPAMPRRKKYPGVAYQTNQLFDPAPADDIRPQTSADRARSAQRNETDRAGRRSKSEGPRQPRWTDTVEPKGTSAALGEPMAPKPELVSTEYRNQFAWPKETDAPRKSISMGALKKAAVAEGHVEAEPLMNHADEHDGRYIEDYLWNGQKPGVQRALPRDEKDGKDSKNHSPKKYRSFRSAPHQSIHAKLQETKALERSPHKTSPQKQRKKLQGHSFDEGAAQDGPAAGEPREFRSPRRRPRSADPAPAPAPAPARPAAVANGHDAPRPNKPTGLPLNRGASSRVRSSRGGRSPSAPAKPVNGVTLGVNGATGTPGRGRRSRSISKVGIKLDDDIPAHRSASVAKDHFFDDSPVVKSPPEPTRVKSPEQMNMRSPDPVNWTVPLDTGKTFTVTQNVKSDETVKRPSSEFKGASVAEDGPKPQEIAPIHHQQMSPIRSLKKSDSPNSLSKRTDKTPTTPVSLTPIDETKALDMNKLNGVNGVNGVNSNQLTPETPVQDFKEVVKKSTEATQVAPGVVDTTVVNDGPTDGLTAAEVLDRARTRFDKFWGKKEEDNV